MTTPTPPSSAVTAHVADPAAASLPGAAASPATAGLASHRNDTAPGAVLQPAPAAATARRRWELDALRGLMLVLMTLTHLPTRFSDPFGQPFGYVSAAEGFVLLSAFMAGLVYGQRAVKHGIPAMRSAFMRRAMKIYACHAALLLFLFTVIAAIGIVIDQKAVEYLMTFYLYHPLTALWSGLLLVYNPPLLDILPMYILFMLLSPLVLAHGLKHGWKGILGLSTALWVGAQLGVGAWLYNRFAAATHFPVPIKETGSFAITAWQFLWVLGLWMGSGLGVRGEADNPVPRRFPRWMVLVAIGYALACLAARHVVGQVPFPGTDADSAGNLLFDKWTLGPLRMLNLLSMLLLALHFGPWLVSHLPRMTFLETLGSASLPVFCVQLVLVLGALAFVGQSSPERPLWIDVLVVAGSFGVLTVTAWFSQRLDLLTAKAKEAAKQAAARRKAARSGLKAQSGSGD